MEVNIDVIEEKIKKLINQKKITNSFNKVLTQNEINSFEKKYTIELPEDYKQFITTIGNGGPGPNYGIFSLQESIIDFKLEKKPMINIASNFIYKNAWNESWIASFDWENDRPETSIVSQYMDVNHISGSLQISHYGHGCTNLLIVKGECKGQIWFDGRADYGGLAPELDELGHTFTFFNWYNSWLDEIIVSF